VQQLTVPLQDLHKKTDYFLNLSVLGFVHHHGRILVYIYIYIYIYACVSPLFEIVILIV
jgi:hypothetical protein